MKKSKWILQTLILSGALNAALLCTFFYFIIRENPIYFSYLPKEEVSCQGPLPISSNFFERLRSFPFLQLVELLHDERKVEQGFRIRDFALGALASFYDFDVERGLGRGGLSKRRWEHEERSFLLFPGLSEHDFDLLKTFAHTERYPFTPKGLFKKILEVEGEGSDPDLLSFFCHTPQFVLLETLFARTQLPIQKKTILALILEGGWVGLEKFYAEQQRCADFSEQARVKYLMTAIEKGSKSAAYLLLATDFDYAIKILEDREIAVVLDLLSDRTEEALKFAQNVALSPRGDTVRNKALVLLVEHTGKIPSEVAGHFYEKPGLKDLRPVFRQQPPAAPTPNTHVVQPGESLWIIARKYSIPVETLVEFNHLQTTVIQPGKMLKIP